MNLNTSLYRYFYSSIIVILESVLCAQLLYPWFFRSTILSISYFYCVYSRVYFITLLFKKIIFIRIFSFKFSSRFYISFIITNNNARYMIYVQFTFASVFREICVILIFNLSITTNIKNNQNRISVVI